MKRKSTRPHRMMENLFRPLNPPQTSRNHLKNKNTGVTSALSDSRTLKSFKQVTLFNCVSAVERSQGLHITGQLSEHKRAGYSSWRPENTEERSRNSLSPEPRIRVWTQRQHLEHWVNARSRSRPPLANTDKGAHWWREVGALVHTDERWARSRTLTRARTGDERWARSCILTRGGRAREHWQGRALVTRGGRAREHWWSMESMVFTLFGLLSRNRFLKDSPVEQLRPGTSTSSGPAPGSCRWKEGATVSVTWWHVCVLV